MQSISGSFYQAGANAIGGATTAGSVGGPATLTTVNNIMTALVGSSAGAHETAAPQLATTMSGALGNSISALLKNSDNKLDMSDQDWAAEVLQHQDDCQQLTQDFAQKLTGKEAKLGSSGFAVPGLDTPELKNILEEEEE